MEAKGKTKKAAKLAPPPGAVVDSEKLGQQLAAVKVLGIDALGHLVGKETLDAVLSGKDAPSADAALPAVGDVGADADATAKAEKAVGAAAISAAGVKPSIVVARRVLAAACVREEVTALQGKLVLVGDRQVWALGRKEREEARRAAKEAAKEKKEDENEEKQKEMEEAVARTRNRGPGDVDKQDSDDDDDDNDDDDDSEDEKNASHSENDDVNEDDWSSGGEDDDRCSVSDESDSDSEDVVIHDEDDELRKFLAQENGEAIGSDDDEEEDAKFERDSDSDVDPDEELPPELAKILGVEQKGVARGSKANGKASSSKDPSKPLKKEPAKKEKKPKKRMGQRARRQLAEQMYGDNANHVKMEREERERQKRQAAEQEANMHPAWAAKRAAAAALAAAPKGRKVAFGEDGVVAGDRGHAGQKREVPPPPPPGGGGRGEGRDFGGRGGGRGGRGGGRDSGGRGGGDRLNKTPETKPKKEKAQRAPRVYIGEIKGGTGEVVGKVTKNMGPSGEKGKDAKASGSKGNSQYDTDAAAAAHPAWAAKRKAANEAWGSVKPSGKKIKF